MAGMFHYANIYALTNDGSKPCTLDGFPSVSAFDGPVQNPSTAITVPTRHTKLPPWGERPKSVTIKPRGSAGLILGYVANPDASGCPGPNERGSTFQVTLPRATAPLITDETSFDVCSGEAKYSLYVSPVLPEPGPT
jgi:Protein of unknown function (DUF4232)